MSAVIRRVLPLVTVVLGASLLSTPAQAANWMNFPAGWVVNCATGHRTTDCIEKLELAKPETDNWVAATIERNESFTVGTVQPREDIKGNCGDGRGDIYDACYVFKGQGAGGSDIRMRLQAEVGADQPGQQALTVTGWVMAGGTEIATRADGWKAEALPVGTRVRITMKSDAFARDVGWLVTSFKQPLLTVNSGSDGVKRVVISGATDVMWGMKQGENDPKFCERSDTTAGTVATGFLITANAYAFTTEKLKGTAAGGVMVGVNGNCGSGEVFFDANDGILAVRVGGPHYDFSGKEIVGWLEASIRGDVVRKAFGKDPSKLDNVRVSITYGTGAEQVATSNTRYLATTDSVEIRAYGFNFSTPNIRMKIGDGKIATAPQQAPRPAKSITCVKGKVIKKVAGTKCPAGFRKK